MARDVEAYETLYQYDVETFLSLNGLGKGSVAIEQGPACVYSPCAALKNCKPAL